MTKQSWYLQGKPGQTREGKTSKKCGLSDIELKVLRMIKGKKIKDVEKSMPGIIHPITGKPVTISYANLSMNESRMFNKLERRGLISTFGKPSYYINFRVTEKGKDRLVRCRS